MVLVDTGRSSSELVSMSNSTPRSEWSRCMDTHASPSTVALAPGATQWHCNSLDNKVCSCSRTEIKNLKCRIGTEDLNCTLGHISQHSHQRWEGLTRYTHLLKRPFCIKTPFPRRTIQMQRWPFALPFGEWHSRMVRESLHVCHSPWPTVLRSSRVLLLACCHFTWLKRRLQVRTATMRGDAQQSTV